MTHMSLSFLTLDVRLAVFKALNIAGVVHSGMASASKGEASPQPLVALHQRVVKSLDLMS